MSKESVLIAMSGGIDSTVAAAILKENGFDVTGVTFILVEGMTSRASRAAEKLGIRHYTSDLTNIFERDVIEDFISQYKHGRTPNPCIRCNRFVKFEILLQEAVRLSIPYIATGHYAKAVRDPGRKRVLLKKGRDSRKDQSYFLYGLIQEQLQAALLPLGDLTKPFVRSKAKSLGLSSSSESQEICFVSGKDYTGFLRSRIPEAFIPGDILDREGRPLGRHEGIAGFTIGQRRGLGIAAEQPLYVLGIDPERHSVTVGPSDYLYQKTVKAEQINWVSLPPTGKPLTVTAQIRYNQKPQPARLIPQKDAFFYVDFEQPQRAVTPGQAVVCYQGSEVIAGGTIVSGT